MSKSIKLSGDTFWDMMSTTFLSHIIVTGSNIDFDDCNDIGIYEFRGYVGKYQPNLLAYYDYGVLVVFKTTLYRFQLLLSGYNNAMYFRYGNKEWQKVTSSV